MRHPFVRQALAVFPLCFAFALVACGGDDFIMEGARTCQTRHRLQGTPPGGFLAGSGRCRGRSARQPGFWG